MPTRKWKNEFLVNTNLPGVQHDSVVAGLAGGGFMVFWQDDSTADSTIRAQRYDALGNRAGAELVFGSQFLGGEVISPAVTALAGGGFYITYTEVFGLSRAILGHVYDANGAFVRNQGVTAFGSYGNSEVARLGTGSVVVWEDQSGTGGILLKVFDAAGTGGPDIPVISSTASQPAVASAPGGSRFAVVWRGTFSDEGEVFARVFNAAGTLITAMSISVAQVHAGAQSEPVVIWLNDGRFVVAWRDGSGVNDDSDTIRARVFNDSGQAMTGEIAVNSTTLLDQDQPTITALPNGGFVVSWVDFSGTGGDNSASAIRLQAFDGAGGKIGGEMLVNTTTNGFQLNPSISALADGRIVVSWTDLSSGTPDIRSQIVDPRDGIVTGTGAADTLYGHDAVGDEINGYDGNDTLFGLAGNDQLYGGAGNDTVIGGKGDDTAFGGAGNDVLRGGVGDDELYGEGDNDTLFGGAGADILDGGAGSDLASYVGELGELVFALDGSLVASGEIANDTLIGIERLQGGNGVDRFNGDANTNSLYGEGGADILNGKLGSDGLRGGVGVDTLTGGGAGNDFFQFLALTELGDIITDFSANAAGNNDFFYLMGSAFAGLTAATYSSANFITRAADNLAQDSNDRFIFRTSDTTLWFDANGSTAGGAGPVMIANLQTGATMTFADIVIF